MIRIDSFLVCVFASFLLTGCMSSHEILTNDESATMQEIYESHFADVNYDENLFTFTRNTDDTSEFVRETKKEVQFTFPVLKNPVLVMYVFPHFNPVDGTPIPGYWTTIPMYDTIEFALPGEQLDTGAFD